MTGPTRSYRPDLVRARVREKARAPLGYSTPAAARQGAQNREASAAALRALVDRHGERIRLSWDAHGMRVWTPPDAPRSEHIARVSVRYWEARGWARLEPDGKAGAWLEVDLVALPEGPG